LELEVAWYIRKNHSRLANRQARDKAKGEILKKIITITTVTITTTTKRK
jgi:hypothetical protein